MRETHWPWTAVWLAAGLIAGGVSHAQPPGGTTLTYLAGSSVKIEQVIGDVDWQDAAKGVTTRTASQTVTRFNIAGNGQGGSFEAGGKMIFFFGDTISSDPAAVNYHGADPIAWSTSTDPEAGLLLNFYTAGSGLPLFVAPPGVPMGPDDIPNSGLFLNGQIYFICNAGSDVSLSNPQAGDYSYLATFNEGAQTFAAGRTLSPTGGRVIGTAVRAFGANVYVFGAGPYRASDIYLQMVPAATFASGAGTQYFAGLVNGQPTWQAAESAAVPVVQDNPLQGPAWPNDNPSVGNVSVVYSPALSLWLMTYDGGRQTHATTGSYFTYAPQPWGPWAPPQLIFNRVRDHAYGVGGFIHDPAIVPDPPGDGLNGPTIGNLAGANNIYTTAGGDFAPLMIERFVTVSGTVLRLYYNLSTWNPYTIVRMRSQFTIAAGSSAPPVIMSQPSGHVIANGATVTFAVSASGSPTYQWSFNGTALAGATQSTLVLFGATAANAGSYACAVSNAAGTSQSAPATLQVTTTQDPGRLVNESVLAQVQGVLTVGFVIGSGSGAESLLLRATGPALAGFGVAGWLPDPVLTLIQQSNKVVLATNSGWATPAGNQALVAAADSATGAFALPDPASKDSALVRALPPSAGGYSLQVKAGSGGTGTALTEVYDNTAGYTPAAARIINESCLTTVAPGAILTAGFVIGGSTSKTVLVRATGPALTAFGVSGVMPDPRLEVRALGAPTPLTANAGWGGQSAVSAAEKATGAFTLSNPASLDSAVLLTLAPGAYTAQVSSVSGAGGTALVEVYDVP